MSATSTKRTNALVSRALALTLLASELSQRVDGFLTNGGIVTADSWENGQSQSWNVIVDGKFTFSRCIKTNPTTEESWIDIDFGRKTVVQHVYIMKQDNQFGDAGYELNGSDFYVGDNIFPFNNTPCNVGTMQISSLVSCGGKIGRYLGIRRATSKVFSICQIRAYSYIANSYPDYTYHTAPQRWPFCDTSNLILPGRGVSGSSCVLPVIGYPAYFNMVFNQPRYIHAVVILAQARFNFYGCYYFISVGDETESSVIQHTQIFRQANIEVCYGSETKIGAYGKSVGIYKNDNTVVQQTLEVQGVLIFTTASDCSGPFNWSGSRSDWRIPITTSAQVITGLLAATIDDCAVFHGELLQADGFALPSFITYDINTKTATVNVDASHAPTTVTVRTCAFLDDRVTQAKSECKNTVIELVQLAAFLAFSDASFYHGIALPTPQVTLNIPAVSFQPPNATVELSYSLDSATQLPFFLSLQQIGGTTKLVIGQNATMGNINFIIRVTDIETNLQASINATLVLNECYPTGFTISPSTLNVAISGPSLTSLWSKNAVNPQCGTYSVSVETSFAYLITVVGQSIFAQAPINSLVGTFQPIFTLKNDEAPLLSATASLTVIVICSQLTSLTFNLTPPATTFYFETELQSIQKVFDLPAIAYEPLYACKEIYFLLINAPSFLTLKQTILAAKGVISPSAYFGTFNFQVTVKDTFTNLSASVDTNLFIYSCQPYDFVLTPNFVLVSILGASETIAWSYRVQSQACKYQVHVQQHFDSIIKVNGQKLVVFAPETASIGSFNPYIYLIRDDRSASVYVTLALKITRCRVDSLKFSLQPDHMVNLDLNTYKQTIAVPFKTEQTPLCNYKVIFDLIPSSLSFLSVQNSTFSDGTVYIQNSTETKNTTYSVTLRAQVDGKSVKTNFFVNFLPKLEPALETVTDYEQDLNQQIFDWKAAFSASKAKLDRNKFVPDPPNPYFQDLHVNGTVIIGFSSHVKIVPNLDMINNGTIYLEDQEYYNKSRRQLGWKITNTNNAEKKKKPVLEVEVIPGAESQAQDLAFRWNVTQLYAKQMHLQLYYDYPLNVSSKSVSLLLLTSCRCPTQFE